MPHLALTFSPLRALSIKQAKHDVRVLWASVTMTTFSVEAFHLSIIARKEEQEMARCPLPGCRLLAGWAKLPPSISLLQSRREKIKEIPAQEEEKRKQTSSRGQFIICSLNLLFMNVRGGGKRQKRKSSWDINFTTVSTLYLSPPFLPLFCIPSA